MPNPVPVHYIWVGEPPEPDSKNYGQDIIGARMMAQYYPEQPIHFWCLDDQIAYYKQYFEEKGVNNVEVHGIEGYVNSQRPDANQVHQRPGANFIEVKFLDLIEKLKTYAQQHEDAGQHADKSRDYVTIKAAFQYYLQIAQEGYFMDSNIVPLPPSNDSENYICNKDDLPEGFACSWFYSNDFYRCDPWLMRSLGNNQHAKEKFLFYLDAANKFLPSDGISYSSEDRNALGESFLVAACTPQKNGIYWAESTENDILVVQESLKNVNNQPAYDATLGNNTSIRKFYFNTHRQGNNEPNWSIIVTPNSQDIVKFYIDELSLDITKQYIINNRITTHFHESVKHNNTPVLNLLLDAINTEIYANNLDDLKADTARYGNVNPQEFARALNKNQAIISIAKKTLSLEHITNNFKWTISMIYNLMTLSADHLSKSGNYPLVPIESSDNDYLDFIKAQNNELLWIVIDRYLQHGPITEDNIEDYKAYILRQRESIGVDTEKRNSLKSNKKKEEMSVSVQNMVQSQLQFIMPQQQNRNNM